MPRAKAGVIPPLEDVEGVVVEFVPVALGGTSIDCQGGESRAVEGVAVASVPGVAA